MRENRKSCRIRRWGINLGVAMASIVITLVILEVLLRFTSYRNFIAEMIGPPNYFKPDPAKGYDISENIPAGNIGFWDWDYVLQFEIWSNELGCFDRPYGGEKDYILLVGDSFTHCAAPFQDKWGTLMEELLENRVLKCGVAGYGTRQELLKSKEIIGRVQNFPQLIVVGYFLNDLQEDYEFHCRMLALQRKENSPKGGRPLPLGEFHGLQNIREELFRKAKLWPQQHSVLYVFVREILKSNISFHPIIADLLTDVGLLSPYRYMEFAATEHPVIREAWKIHLQNFREFKELVQKGNAKLLFVLIPRKEQVYSWLRGWAGVDPEGPNKKLRHFLQTEGIDCLDLLPLLKPYANPQPRAYLDRGKDLYWRFDGHLNIKGNHLTGLLVSKYVLEKGLIRIMNPENALKKIDQKLARFH